MIIQLRGTSGSGKSTIVKRVMEQGLGRTPIAMLGRRQPLGYYVFPHSGSTLFVPGHYETPCGGCDTILSLDAVYQLIHKEVGNGCNVLYEGIMASGEYRRCVVLKDAGHEVFVIGLTTPIQECVAAVAERRKARGELTPMNPARTLSRADEVRRMMKHLESAGVRTAWLSRDEALVECLKLLGVQ